MQIEEYLKQNNVPYETHEHSPTYTAQEVAAAEHVSGKMTAKTVLVRSKKGYAVCVLPANLKLDLKKTAKHLKAKSVRLADETELAEIFPDVEVGAEPPFGNLYDLPTLVDEHLATDEEILFQAGSHRKAVRLKYADYAALVKPDVHDLSVKA